MVEPLKSAPTDTLSVELLAALGPVLLLLLKQADVALSVRDLSSGTYVHASPALVALLGKTAASEVVGHTDADLFDATSANALRHAESSALSGAPLAAGDVKVTISGTAREWRVSHTLLITDGAASHVCCLWVDLSAPRQRDHQLKLALTQLEQQQHANDQLRREMGDGTLRDQVTGLYTHAHFDDQLRREVDLSSREHREFALVAIAIDPPTKAVLTRGPAARTRVLEALGRLLRSNTRAMDASCRFDEERFAVLLSGVGLATAHSRMEGFRRQCATQIVVLDGEDLGFTVSMGVASFPHTAKSEQELLDACDAALAEAKRRGGNQVTLASIRLDAL